MKMNTQASFLMLFLLHTSRVNPIMHLPKPVRYDACGATRMINTYLRRSYPNRFNTMPVALSSKIMAVT